jgi:hypothetical protein
MNRAKTDASARLAHLVKAFAHALETERVRQVQRRDAEGFLLFVGEDGAPTREPRSETLRRNREGQPLFRAPLEMQERLHPATLEAFTQGELWERHFIDVPHGDRRLEAWTRDLANLLRESVPHAPMMDDLPREEGRAAARARDLTFLFDELEAHRAESVDSGEGELTETRRLLEAAWAELMGERPLPSPRPRASQLPALSPRVLSLVAHHVAGELKDRLALAEALGAYALEEPPRGPLSNLAWPRAALLEVLHAELGLRARNRLLPRLSEAMRSWPANAVERPDAASFALLSALLDAEAMAERGTRAFLALGEGVPAALSEATKMAEELAAATLGRTLKDA